MKKSLGVAAYVILAAIASCLLAETILHIHEHFFEDPHQAYADEYRRSIDAHIHTLWTGDPSLQDPFIPPFPVFANRGADDPQRTQMILSATQLPPSRSWNSYDFIRVNTDTTATAYTVTSNSFGFRGREYSKIKPPNTYRIIVLGSYQAFGLGVSDADTYPSQLEKMLNARRDGVRYEVWNAGFPAATAIVGLERMQQSIFDYKPDLIILDYGMLDDRIIGDNFFPAMALVPGTSADSLFKRYSGPIVSVLDHSLLWNNLMQNRFRDRSNAAVFSTMLQEMTDLSWNHHVPTILVQQYFAHALNTDGYEKLTNDHIFFFNVRDWFAQHEPTYPPASEWTTGFWSSTYLSELNPKLVSTSTPQFEFYPYRLNFYQLNARGLTQVARGLEQLIEKDVHPKHN